MLVEPHQQLATWISHRHRVTHQPQRTCGGHRSTATRTACQRGPDAALIDEQIHRTIVGDFDPLHVDPARSLRLEVFALRLRIDARERIDHDDQMWIANIDGAASMGDIDMKLRFGGLKSMLAREGAFFLEISGEGDLWFTTYGGIEAIDVNGSYIVDNGNLVGFEGQIDFSLRSAGGGLMGMLASGEGMVCEFKGKGRVYIQSRNLTSLVGWLAPHFNV